MSDNITLEQKMQEAQQGNQQRYAEVLKELTPLIRGVIRKKINNPDDAEDIVQEVLVSIHRARHTYDGKRPLRPWVMAIVKFRLNDYLRKHYKKAEREVVDYDSVAYGIADEDVTETPGEHEVYDVLAALPDKQRMIVEMMKIEGRTAKEVAEKLDMSVSAVKVAAHRAYKTMKQQLEAMAEE